MSRPARILALALALVLQGAAGCGDGRDGGGDRRAAGTQPGDLALDYVTDRNFGRLRVEIDYISGFAPSAEAMERIRETWARRLEKPGGVEVFLDTEIPRSFARDRWEIGDIVALESQFRDHFTGDARNRRTAVIWIVYLNGRSEFDEGQTRALGVAYEGSSIAIFRENIAATTALPLREAVESLVLLHEGGHLFGLVNNGIPMVNDHEDPDHPRHDVNPDCVMYHQIETSNVEALLDGTAPIDYDIECQRDIFAAGGPPPEEAPPALASETSAPHGAEGEAARAGPSAAPPIPYHGRPPAVGGRGRIVPDLATLPDAGG